MKKHPFYDIQVTEGGKIYSSFGTELKTREDPCGYILCSVWQDGKTRTCRVHRLVAQTYISNPEGKREVNHIDGDKSNNHVSNLEWCTSLENKAHAWENNLYKDVLDQHHNARLTNDQVHTICQMIQDGARSIDIAKKFGVHKDFIASIRTGRNWTGISKDYNLRTKRSKTKSRGTVLAICHQIMAGKTSKEISESFNMTPLEVNRIKRKDIFKDITEGFSFPGSKSQP